MCSARDCVTSSAAEKQSPMLSSDRDDVMRAQRIVFHLVESTSVHITASLAMSRSYSLRMRRRFKSSWQPAARCSPSNVATSTLDWRLRRSEFKSEARHVERCRVHFTNLRRLSRTFSARLARRRGVVSQVDRHRVAMSRHVRARCVTVATSCNDMRNMCADSRSMSRHVATTRNKSRRPARRPLQPETGSRTPNQPESGGTPQNRPQTPQNPRKRGFLGVYAKTPIKALTPQKQGFWGRFRGVGAWRVSKQYILSINVTSPTRGGLGV